MRAKRPADQVRALFYRKKLLLRFGKALKSMVEYFVFIWKRLYGKIILN